MKTKLLLRKLELRKDKFLVVEALKEDCKKLRIKYLPTIKYLLRRKYLVRILRGIFYVNSIEERKLNKTNITYYDALKNALDLKGVKNWYFGLNTALKFNNLTHEYFNTDYLLSDSLFRPKPIKIMGHFVKFIKLKKELFEFGIIKNNVNYSDPEKTILDSIYLNKYHGLSDAAIKSKVVEIIENCSKNKIRNYLKHYPLTVKKFVSNIV